MAQILVVDDTAIFREPIAAALRHQGHHATGACDGSEAIHQVRRKRPDLILLDMAMPVMDGMEVLRQLQSDPLTRDIPVIVLSAIAEERVTRKAQKMGACDYLLKSSFSLNELFERVHAHLPDRLQIPDTASPPPSRPAATSPRPVVGDTDADLSALRPLLTAAQAREKLEVCQPLSGYSPGIARLLQLTGQENADLQQTLDELSRNPELAFRLRRIMNSAVFPGGNSTDPLSEGIRRIGVGRIHQMVLNLGILEHFASRSYAPLLDNGLFWEHAIATGLIAAEIFSSSESTSARTDQAFTMGLLHDVGRLVMLEQMPEEVREVFRLSQERQQPLEPLERRLLHCTHASVMDDLLHRWNFPAEVIDPIVLHHLPAEFLKQYPTDHPQDTAYLAVAEALAKALILGHSGDDFLRPVKIPEAWPLPEGTLERICREVPAQVHPLKLALLGHVFEGDWPGHIEKLTDDLPAPVSILFTGSAEGTQATALFCRRWNQALSPRPANVAVVHLADATHAETLGKRLEIAEREQGLKKLPVVMLSDTGEATLPGRVLTDRRHQTMKTPVSIHRLLHTLAGLTG